MFFHGELEQPELEEGRGYLYPLGNCSRLSLPGAGLSGSSEAGLSGFRIIRPPRPNNPVNNPGEPDARVLGDLANFWLSPTCRIIRPQITNNPANNPGEPEARVLRDLVNFFD